MEIEEKKSFKVEALTRFLFAPTGRIYDPKDVFEVKTESDFIYLTETNKLCKKAKDDAEITETDQDRRDKLAVEASVLEAESKEEIKAIIEEKFPVTDTEPIKKAKAKTVTKKVQSKKK